MEFSNTNAALALLYTDINDCAKALLFMEQYKRRKQLLNRLSVLVDTALSLECMQDQAARPDND